MMEAGRAASDRESGVSVVAAPLANRPPHDGSEPIQGTPPLASSGVPLVWTLAPDGRADDLAGWRAYTGQTSAAVRGWGWLDAIYQDDRERVRQEWSGVLVSEQPATLECRVRRHDGEYHWLLLHLAPMRTADGELREWVVVGTDVTARQQVDEALRAAPVTLYRTDRALRYTWVQNAEHFATAGLVGKTADELMAPPQAEALRALKRQALETGEPAQGVVATTTGGQTYYFDFTTRPLRDATGVIVGVTGAAVEVTSRQRAQANQQFLARVTSLLTSTLDAPRIGQRLARLIVPEWADFCLVHVLTASGESELIAAAHREPAGEATLTASLREPRPGEASSLIADVLSSGEPRFYPEATAASGLAEGGDPALGQILAPVSLIAMPLLARGRVLGVLTLGMAESGRRYDDDDLALCRDLAWRAAYALDNARLYQEAQAAIAARDQALAAVEAERARLETVLRQLPVGVIIAEAPSGRLLLGNEQVTRIWDRPFFATDDVTGYAQYQGFHADGRPYTPEEWPLVRALATGEVIASEEIDFQRGDSTRGTMVVSAAPVRDTAGAVVAGVVTFSDITARKEAEARLALLAEIGKLATESPDTHTCLAAIAHALVPRLADYCVIILFDDIGVYQPQVAVHADPAHAALLTELARLYRPDLQNERSPIARALRRGEVVWASEVDSAGQDAGVRDREVLRLYRQLNPVSYAAVPLLARGRVIGVIICGYSLSGRHYAAADVALLEAIASRCALSLDNARLYQEAQAALALAETERGRLRDLFMQAPALIAVTRGPDHVIELVNPEYLRLIRPRQEAGLVGKPGREAVPGLSDQGFFELMDEVYRTGIPFVGREVLAKIDRLDGKGLDDAYFDFVYQPSRDVTGAVDGLLIHGVEVTAQVRARQRVEELAAAAATERDRLQQVLDLLPVAVVIASRDGHYIASNRAATAILGCEMAGQSAPLESEDSFGARHLDGTPYPVRALPVVRSLRDGAVITGEQLSCRNVVTERDIPILVNSAPLRDATGAITSAMVVFQDITPLKELELVREEFLSSTTHDLKTPLTAILGLAQLLQHQLARNNTPENGQYAERLGQIVTVAKRMATQLNQLQDTALLSVGQPLALEWTETDLVALVRQVVQEAQATSLQHHLHVEATVPELCGAVDASRLARVLNNLFSNAIKYSPAGGDVIITIARVEEQDGPAAMLTVRDHGLGIPAADQAHIFERYRRAGNAAGIAPGAGIGLASVQQIIEQHGGRIALESEEGQGTTITLWLPLAGRPEG